MQPGHLSGLHQSTQVWIPIRHQGTEIGYPKPDMHTKHAAAYEVAGDEQGALQEGKAGGAAGAGKGTATGEAKRE